MKWDTTGNKHFQGGVDHVALYVARPKTSPLNVAPSSKVLPYPSSVTSLGQSATGYKIVTGEYDRGVEWNGITAINENPSGGETTTLYADNIAYLNMQSAEKYGFSIEAYDYPDAWEACDGTAIFSGALRMGQQKRAKFALAYRTWVGSDTEALGDDEIIHFVWGCSAAVSSRNHTTVNESPEAATMSWECTATTVSWSSSNSFDGTGSTAQTTYPVQEYKTAHMSVKRSDCEGTNNKNARNKPMIDAYNYLVRTAFGNPNVEGDGFCMSPEGVWLTLNFYDGSAENSQNEHIQTT